MQGKHLKGMGPVEKFAKSKKNDKDADDKKTAFAKFFGKKGK